MGVWYDGNGEGSLGRYDTTQPVMGSHGLGMSRQLVPHTHPKAKSRWLDVIVEKVSMLSPRLLDTPEEVGCVMRGKSVWFGGIHLILVGDFWQISPIGSYAGVYSPDRLLQSARYLTETTRCCFQSRAWAEGPLQLYLLICTWRYSKDKQHVISSA